MQNVYSVQKPILMQQQILKVPGMEFVLKRCTHFHGSDMWLVLLRSNMQT